MQPFTVHWSPVPRGTGDVALFALWPAPVNDDACFREAGFTDFDDADASWDASAEDLLTRLLEELGRQGPPRLRDESGAQRQPWFRRLFDKPKPLSLRERIEESLHWDNVPDCVVAFGERGASLRTGSGHHIFWIALPASEAESFADLVSRVAGPHPTVRTELKWECLLP